MGILELEGKFPEFGKFLLSPSIDPAKKIAVIENVFREKLTPTLLDFIDVVVKKNRQLYLQGMFREFISLYEEKAGLLHVDAVSAVPLEDSSRESLEGALSEKLQKTVLLENRVQRCIERS